MLYLLFGISAVVVSSSDLLSSSSGDDAATGIPPHPDALLSKPMIFGGEDVDAVADNFQWMVQLSWVPSIGIGAGSQQGICSGSLIQSNPPVVLTAAHCIDDLSKSGNQWSYGTRAGTIWARIGITNTGANADPLVDLRFDANTRLEWPDVYSSDNIHSGDVGLIFFGNSGISPGDQSILDSIEVPALPAQLPANSNEQCCKAGESMTALGYGVTTSEGEGDSKLQRGVLYYTARNDCSVNDRTKEICTSSWKSNTCVGDSGGPLLQGSCADGKDRVIYGVHSCTSSRCLANSYSYSAAASIAYWREWIDTSIATFGAASATVTNNNINGHGESLSMAEPSWNNINVGSDIVFGEDVADGKYDFVVFILVWADSAHYSRCSGVLIQNDPAIVLVNTACVRYEALSVSGSQWTYGSTNVDVYMDFGRKDVSTDKLMTPEQNTGTIVRMKWDENTRYEATPLYNNVWWKNAVGLVYLEPTPEQASLLATIKTPDLPNEMANGYECCNGGERFTVMGFGKTTNEGNGYTNMATRLQRTYMRYVPGWSCDNIVSWIDTNYMCLKDEAQESAACAYDYGGAVVQGTCEDDDSMVVYGMVALHFTGCPANVPSIAYSLAYYRGWINQVVDSWNTQYNNKEVFMVNTNYNLIHFMINSNHMVVVIAGVLVVAVAVVLRCLMGKNEKYEHVYQPIGDVEEQN